MKRQKSGNEKRKTKKIDRPPERENRLLSETAASFTTCFSAATHKPMAMTLTVTLLHLNPSPSSCSSVSRSSSLVSRLFSSRPISYLSCPIRPRVIVSFRPDSGHLVSSRLCLVLSDVSCLGLSCMRCLGSRQIDLNSSILFLRFLVPCLVLSCLYFFCIVSPHLESLRVTVIRL